MDVTKFNFLPAAYDRIIYIAEGYSQQINGIGYQKEVLTNGIGFFMPLCIMSLDQVNWYSTDFPPQTPTGGQAMSGSVVVHGDKFVFTGSINGTAYQTGTHNIYFKLLGIEL